MLDVPLFLFLSERILPFLYCNYCNIFVTFCFKVY